MFKSVLLTNLDWSRLLHIGHVFRRVFMERDKVDIYKNAKRTRPISAADPRKGPGRPAPPPPENVRSGKTSPIRTQDLPYLARWQSQPYTINLIIWSFVWSFHVSDKQPVKFLKYIELARTVKSAALDHIYSLFKQNIKSGNASGEGNAGERWKTAIGLISKKATLHAQQTFFLRPQRETCWNFLVTRFIEEMSYVFSFTFFSLPLIFTLHWWPLEFLIVTAAFVGRKFQQKNVSFVYLSL